jgi:Rad52/22 family double-strand break repair protein
VNREVMCRPFPAEAIRSRPGQHGRTLSYVNVGKVLERLHEACNAVAFEVLRHEILETEVIVVGRLTADGIVNVDFGTAPITLDADGRALSVGDDLKAASSDCIKRCARLLGCPLDLNAQVERTVPAPPKPRAPPPAPDDRLTSRQLAALQAACRRRGWSSARLTTMVDERFGKNNPQALTRTEASSLISELTAANGH